MDRLVCVVGAASVARELALQSLNDAALVYGVEVHADCALNILAAQDPAHQQGALWHDALLAQRAYQMTVLVLPGPADPAPAFPLDLKSAAATDRVTACLRSALVESGLAFCVLGGDAEQICAGALVAVKSLCTSLDAEQRAKWRWACADCDDGACEGHLLSALRQAKAEPSPIIR